MRDLDDLLRRAAAGDDAAFDAVVLATARNVRGYLAVHVGDLDAVDDLAQETYLHLHAHLADYRPGTSPMAWIMHTAKFRMLAFRRASLRRRDAHRRYAAEVQRTLSESAFDADADAVPAVSDRLARCLDGLGPAAAELVRRRYVHDEPVAAIATDMGRTANQVSVALFRIRAKLASCLAQAGIPA